MSIRKKRLNAINSGSQSVNAIARARDGLLPTITRFIHDGDMRLSSADKLAAYFGLTPTTARRGRARTGHRVRCYHVSWGN